MSETTGRKDRKEAYDAQHLLGYLDDRQIKYRVEHHPRSETAMETAAARHVSGKRFAKTVVIRSGEDTFLAVLPAHLQVDFAKLEKLSGRKDLRLATEDEFASLFANCEVGAMAPFGHMYDMDLYIDDDIAVAPEVTFNACTHEHTITVAGKDFLRACEGVVGDFSREMEG